MRAGGNRTFNNNNSSAAPSFIYGEKKGDQTQQQAELSISKSYDNFGHNLNLEQSAE